MLQTLQGVLLLVLLGVNLTLAVFEEHMRRKEMWYRLAHKHAKLKCLLPADR